MITRVFISTLVSCLCVATATESTANTSTLWYSQPAIIVEKALPWAAQDAPKDNLPGKPAKNGKGQQTNDPWESQTLPIGNGRIGGTVYGGDQLDCINLNEVSLWSGGPNLPKNGFNYVYGPTAGKEDFGSYQPFGNLYIQFSLPEKGVEHYRRQLDLKEGVHSTTFTCDGVEHKRISFVSEPDDVMVYSAGASTPGNVSAKIALTPYHSVSYTTGRDNTIIMSGKLKNGQLFEGRIIVRHKGGTSKVINPGKKELKITYTQPKITDRMQPVINPTGIPYIEVKDADSMDIIIAMATNYKQSYAAQWVGKNPAKCNTTTMLSSSKKCTEQLLHRHIQNYQSLYNRLDIQLGSAGKEVEALPTDERIARYKQTKDDPGLEALIYQYGRYVLISGSRPGNLPVNLQGIWNNKVHAPWASDYHNNINLQMCYWGAEVGNLSECHRPLLQFINSMRQPLHEMTCKQFGKKVRGWTTRISQNPWGGGGWKKWNPPVNAWYALHLWDHYQYTGDTHYLRKTAYPILKEICQFWEDELKEIGAQGKGLKTQLDEKSPILDLKVEEHPELAEIKEGTLVCPMGWSHEWGPLEDGCAHDQQLVWELFENTITAARILNVDEAWASQLAEKQKRLAGNRIGSGGYLQEWIVDRPNMLKGQRHTSHLIGVYPGTSISLAKTPEIAKAAMKSLELRGLSADNRRSWTWPWRTALWARFKDADKAHSMIQHYICYNLLDNLFGDHPPMQMDGTYGMTGGISEMLLQSHAGQIELLPALPNAWKDGYVHGIRARGNITVSMAWKDGEITSYTLTTTTPNPKPVTVVVNGVAKEVTPTVVQK
ncbi:MAG: glycoside hydrolase N-terminal domain-containing protein [Akkermansia sp.]|nr:glycoside hydrolase N-terminal domain-containing protein [Akkermansia sp.]